MSVPVAALRNAGVWNSTTNYVQNDFVRSPTDSKLYVYIGVKPVLAGFPDPAVGGLPNWVELEAPNPLPPLFAPAYGSFSSTQTQLINAAFPLLSPLTLAYDTADVPPVGVAVIGFPGAAPIRVAAAGVYKVLSSVQLDKTTGGLADVDLYITANGVPVPNSATKLNINQNQEDLMTVEWFITLPALGVIEVVLESAVAGIRALAVPAAGTVPSIPSVITTILRIA